MAVPVLFHNVWIFSSTISFVGVITDQLFQIEVLPSEMPSLGELGVLAVLGGIVGLWGLWAGRGQVISLKRNQCVARVVLQAPVLSCILESSGLPGLEGKVVLVTGANAGRVPKSHNNL